MLTPSAERYALPSVAFIMPEPGSLPRPSLWRPRSQRGAIVLANTLCPYDPNNDRRFFNIIDSIARRYDRARIDARNKVP